MKGRSSALPAEKLLQLAQVMVAKQAQRGGIQTYEQLMLYLDILQVCFYTIHTIPTSFVSIVTRHLPAYLLAKVTQACSDAPRACININFTVTAFT